MIRIRFPRFSSTSTAELFLPHDHWSVAHCFDELRLLLAQPLPHGRLVWQRTAAHVDRRRAGQVWTRAVRRLFATTGYLRIDELRRFSQGSARARLHRVDLGSPRRKRTDVEGA